MDVAKKINANTICDNTLISDKDNKNNFLELSLWKLASIFQSSAWSASRINPSLTRHFAITESCALDNSVLLRSSIIRVFFLVALAHTLPLTRAASRRRSIHLYVHTHL